MSSERNPLSRRQIQVLEYIREGRSNQWIADRLFVSKALVELEVIHCRELLNATNRTHAVIKAIRRGYIKLEGYTTWGDGESRMHCMNCGYDTDSQLTFTRCPNCGH